MLSLTDYSKVAKIAGRHKIAFIKAEGYVSQLSATQEKPKDSFSMSGNAQRSPHLAVKWLDWLSSYSTSQGLSPCPTNDVLVLDFLFLILYEVCVHMFVHVCLQAKTSNGTTVGTFSDFNFFWCVNQLYIEGCYINCDCITWALELPRKQGDWIRSKFVLFIDFWPARL